MPGANDDNTIWFVVKELSNDVRRVEDKWGDLIESTTRVGSTVDAIREKVGAIGSALSTSDPQSLVGRLYSLQSDVQNVKEGMNSLNKVNDAILSDLDHIKKMSGIFKTEEEVRQEKWQSFGRVTAILLALATGVAALVRTLNIGG